MLLWAWCSAAGCAAAINFNDPSGPIDRGDYLGASSTPGLLRIVTFNIKFGRQINEAAVLLSRAADLRRADLLILEEVDPAGTEHLARTLGLRYAVVPSAVHPATGRPIGVAVLSPWPVADPRKLLLPHPHRLRHLRRAALRVTVHSPAGPIRVYGVHFETPFGASGRARREQARTLLRDLSDWSGPVVVAGDFNGTGPARELAVSGFDWLTRAVRNTAGVFDVDHILVRGLCATATPAAGRGPSTRGVSDHRPVWAVVAPCVEE